MNQIKCNSASNPSNFGNTIDEFFNKSIAEFIGSDFVSNVPAVNVVESDNSFQLEVAAPGKEKSDFNINIEKDRLTISAEKKTEEETKEKYNRREFSYAAFSRSFTLPETADVDKVSAAYENGVLIIEIPKMEKEEIRKEIKIK